MEWKLLFIVLPAIAFAILIEIAERAKLRKLLDRPSAENLWYQRFSYAPQDAVNEFLKLFVTSFAFDEDQYFKFSPDDQPWAIYKARYISHLNLDDH
ncbi:MAG: hypothetical protein ACKVT0_11330, partial [Planctomycetaceae bacterium]